MNLPALETLVDRHLAAYCDTDAARRAGAIREIWNAEGRLVDPPFESRGHKGISDQAATLLSQFPGHRFERTTAVDAHHRSLRYGWRLVSPEGALVVEASMSRTSMSMGACAGSWGSSGRSRRRWVEAKNGVIADSTRNPISRHRELDLQPCTVSSRA